MPRTADIDAIARQHYRAGGGFTATFGRGHDRIVRVYQGSFRYQGSRRTRDKREVATHTTGDHVQAAVADCRNLGPDWRILSLSTPGTIYRDLTGNQSRQTFEAIVVPNADHDILAPGLLGSLGRSAA